MCAPPRPPFEWAQHPGGGNADLCVRPAGSGSEDKCSAGQPVKPAQLSRPPAEAVRRIFQFVEIRNRSTELHLASAAGRGCTSGSRVTIDTTGQLALGPTGWKPIVRTAAEHGLGAGRPVQTSTKVAPRGGGPSSRPARRLTAWPAAVDPASDDARGTADRFDRAVPESEVPCPMKAEGLRRTSPSE